ncbi:MAG: hypothetical protein ACYCYF_00960, partial [Anaerolineae bacterium]
MFKKMPALPMSAWLPPALSAAMALAAAITIMCAAGCAAPRSPVPAVTPEHTPIPRAAVEPLFVSDGGGEPRSAGYWMLWNNCAPENRAKMARANGGRAAGWILMEDLLADPGILLGELPVETCAQGLN